MYAQQAQNQFSPRDGEAQNSVVHTLTTINVEMTAKFGRVKDSQRTNTIKKPAPDSMKPTQIISIVDLEAE